MEQVAAVHALLEARMREVLADLVRTAPRTPVVCEAATRRSQRQR